MGWLEFIAAFIAFFASHMVPTRPPIRAAIVSAIGPRGFTIAYSTLSLFVLVWLIGAAGRAPFVQLWPWAPWQVHATQIAMLGACLLLSLSVGRPNPFSFGGGLGIFVADRPGLVRWMRHPILMALAVWAAAHLLVNGSLAHVILFGLFLAFTLIGQRGIDRRKRRQMGTDWDTLNAARRGDGLRLPAFDTKELGLRLLAGGILYAALVLLHPALFGVSALV